MRRDCVPTWVDSDLNMLPLRRIRLKDKEFAESYLQELLHVRPELLPVDEVSTDFGPLMSLGREIDSIDNLYIDPSGKLTIVETKLWRNPQAIREVLAQILDYANRVASWSYTKLEEKCRRAQSPAPIAEGSLYELACEAFQDEALDEASFIDSVERSLNTGRFLLLIVGDGIREGLEGLLSALHTQPNLLFTFGLVELQVFESSSGGGSRLIVPQVLAHSTEAVRAVVRVETTGPADVTVELEDQETSRVPGAKKRTLSEDEFFDLVESQEASDIILAVLEKARDSGAIIQPRKSSLSVRVPDPYGSKRRLTLFVINYSGYLYPGWLHEQLDKLDMDQTIASEWVRFLADLVPGVNLSDTNPDALSRYIRVEELSGKLAELEEQMKRTVERINDI